MSPFQYMQRLPYPMDFSSTSRLLYSFSVAAVSRDDSLVIGRAFMLSRMVYIFGKVYMERAITPPSLNRLNTTLIGVSISVCCLSVYNLIHFPIGKRA